MESQSLTLSKVHIVRIDPGEDVRRCVCAFLKEQGVKQAVVLGGYGTLARHSLHWVRHNRLPVENAFADGEGGIEILAMNGLVVASEPHIHVTLSTQVGAYGGHLEEGCIAYVLCEVFLGEVEGCTLSREVVDVTVEDMGTGSVPRLLFGSDQ
jgi:predicted DNA-binding protein with PD1-like motif